MKTEKLLLILACVCAASVLLLIGKVILTPSPTVAKPKTHWFGEMVVGYKNDNGEFITTLDGTRIGVRSDGALVTDFEKEE